LAIQLRQHLLQARIKLGACRRGGEVDEMASQACEPGLAGLAHSACLVKVDREWAGAERANALKLFGAARGADKSGLACLGTEQSQANVATADDQHP